MDDFTQRDPYLSDVELEMADFLGLSTNKKGSTRPLQTKLANNNYIKILIALVGIVILVLILDIHVDKEYFINAKDDEEKEVLRESPVPEVIEANDAITEHTMSWKDLRWHLSDTVKDNCIHGFHLANTTLTCGISVAGGDIEYLTQEHKGIQYCAGVEFEPNSCIEPIFGEWKAPSGNLSELPPLPRRFGVRNYTVGGENDLPRCKTVDEYLINGTVQETGTYYPPKWVQSASNSTALVHKLSQYDQEFVPSSCSSVPLSPFVWTENSSCQTTITMYGDSHIRNLFVATVFGLRGIEMFAEAHASAENKARGIIYSYEWRLHNDGFADDRFMFHGGTDLSNSTYNVSHCSCSDTVKRCLRIFFVWAPLFQEQLSKFHYVKEWETDLLIVEPGNAYEHSTILDQSWKEKLDELLVETKDLRLGVLHWTWGKAPHKDRMNAIKLWFNNSSYKDRVAYMRQDDIIFDSLQGTATFHFACSLQQNDVRNDMIAAAEPCTDRADTSFIRALTTVLFDAFLNVN